MKLELFDYNLPPDLIAQKPLDRRDSSRLMIVNKKNKTWVHEHFFSLDQYLDNNSVLVFNDSKVIPARLKPVNGGEIFLLRDLGKGIWEVMGRKLKQQTYDLSADGVDNLQCKIVGRSESGNWLAKFNCSSLKLNKILDHIGETPLPPYIKIKDSKKIRTRYQTVYARRAGSVAAPTAGLHFTKGLIKKIEKKGAKIEFVTLHVGLGTFQPVKTEHIEKHKIHSELASIEPEVARRLNQYKKKGKKIIAVGTTTCRVLEAFSQGNGRLKSGVKPVCIYIYPGYKFKFINGLITNFHLPKSTLLMLVSALAGRKLIMKVYQEAIKERYRFYSFGDGMML